MPPGGVIVFGKTVSGPQYNQGRIFFKHIVYFIAFLGFHIGIILARIVFPPFAASGLKLGDIGSGADGQRIHGLLLCLILVVGRSRYAAEKKLK